MSMSTDPSSAAELQLCSMLRTLRAEEGSDAVLLYSPDAPSKFEVWHLRIDGTLCDDPDCEVCS